MTFQIHRRDEHRRVPWRNGRGVTWEVAREADPAGTDPGAFLWRLSFAEVVGTAPFSAFPGIDRTITLVEGGPLRLTVEGVVRELRRHEPFAFPGESRVEGVADTASVDLNVMALRGRVEVSVSSHPVGPGADRVVVEPDGVVFVVVLDGVVTVVDSSSTCEAAQWDVVRAGDEPLEVAGAGVVQVVRLAARPTEGVTATVTGS